MRESERYIYMWGVGQALEAWNGNLMGSLMLLTR